MGVSGEAGAASIALTVSSSAAVPLTLRLCAREAGRWRWRWRLNNQTGSIDTVRCHDTPSSGQIHSAATIGLTLISIIRDDNSSGVGRSSSVPAGRRTQIGQGCLLCQAVFIRVTELITSGEREEGKRQLPKTLLKKEREREGKKRNSLQENEAGMTRVWLSVWGMKNSAFKNKARREAASCAKRWKTMHRDHKGNYLHASFVVCHNWHVFQDSGTGLMIRQPRGPGARREAVSWESLPKGK